MSWGGDGGLIWKSELGWVSAYSVRPELGKLGRDQGLREILPCVYN